MVKVYSCIEAKADFFNDSHGYLVVGRNADFLIQQTFLGTCHFTFLATAVSCA